MISDEAYRKLESIKGKKSFTELLSQLVDRLKQSNTENMGRFAGIMSDEEADELQRIVSGIRKGAKARA